MVKNFAEKEKQLNTSTHIKAFIWIAAVIVNVSLNLLLLNSIYTESHRLNFVTCKTTHRVTDHKNNYIMYVEHKMLLQAYISRLNILIYINYRIFANVMFDLILVHMKTLQYLINQFTRSSKVHIYIFKRKLCKYITIVNNLLSLKKT